MIDQKSRYFTTPDATLITTDNSGRRREVRYKKRRFIPAADTTPRLLDHRVMQGERLDHIAYRYLGDPEQFWRICDANVALHPETLVEVPGSIVHLNMPKF